MIVPPEFKDPKVLAREKGPKRLNGWSGGRWWWRVNDRSIGTDNEVDMEFCEVVESSCNDSEEPLEDVRVVDGQNVNIEMGEVCWGKGFADEFGGVDEMGAETE